MQKKRRRSQNLIPEKRTAIVKTRFPVFFDRCPFSSFLTAAAPAWFRMAPVACVRGFEPPTFWSVAKRSIQLS